MSLYIIAALVLAVSAVLAFTTPHIDRLLYYCCLVFISGMLIFRYGQGTDWLGYNHIFNLAPTTLDLSSFFYSDKVHSEIGWKIICNVFRMTGSSFVQLVLTVSLVELFFLNRFIRRWSSCWTLSLLLAYPTLYLTYFFSSLREGLVLAIFLGLLLEWLFNGKDIPYIIAILLLSSIHSVSLIALPLVLVKRLPIRNISTELAISLALGVLGLFIFRLGSAFSAINAYASIGFSPVSLATRVGTALVVWLAWRASSDKDASEDGFLLHVFCYGMCVYFVLMANGLVASRSAILCLALDIVLMPRLFSENPKAAMFLFLAMIALVFVMTLKNVNAYISQGPYVTGISVLNYPYISIFRPLDLYRYSQNRYLIYLSPPTDVGLGLLFS